MKALVIQITRLGDILYSLPAVEAYKKLNPHVELHFLARSTWSSFLKDVPFIDKVWDLNSRNLLEPIVVREQMETSVQRVSQFTETLKAENFDVIFNLSFSPTSSFLAHQLDWDGQKTVGYTRTTDGFLYVPDTASQYFRAHVNEGGGNQLHVIDLMSWVMGVEGQTPLTSWPAQKSTTTQKGDYIVCHIGASQKQKQWPVELWQTTISRLIRKTKLQVKLVGTRTEFLAAAALEAMEPTRIQNLCGSTSVEELACLIKQAKLFIGGDSGPLQVANVTGCPAINISVGDVNFFETGPVVLGSIVLRSQEPWGVSSDQVVDSALKILKYQIDYIPPIEVTNDAGGERYHFHFESAAIGEQKRAWEFVRWLHFKGKRPLTSEIENLELAQAVEVCDLATQQLALYAQKPEDPTPIKILDGVDSVLNLLKSRNKTFGPLMNYFFCRKENIVPGTTDQIISQTSDIYRDLKGKITNFVNETESGHASPSLE